ncbi:hypothetical protein niasHT_034904 [Heterodera trifolii]|uniref:Uncharacterized protein n=1 Tax=Heterodera trifolii TaxID=157864 RepID=A0ABD2I9D0_9BILA
MGIPAIRSVAVIPANNRADIRQGSITSIATGIRAESQGQSSNSSRNRVDSRRAANQHFGNPRFRPYSTNRPNHRPSPNIGRPPGRSNWADSAKWNRNR